MIGLLLAALAVAAPPPEAPSPVAHDPVAALDRGDDLAAWYALPHGTDAAGLAAYQDFVRAWPGSPLAEVAWGRLEAANALGPVWQADDPAVREALAGLEARYGAHRAELARHRAAVVVLPLRPDGSPLRTPAPLLSATLHTGGGWTDGAHATVGIGARWAPVALVGRVAILREVTGQLAARLAPAELGPVVELGLDTRGRPSAVVGARLPVRRDVAVELAGGVRSEVRAAVRVVPAVRVELVQRL